MSLTDSILRIIRTRGAEDALGELVQPLMASEGLEPVRDALLAILRDDSHAEAWRGVMEIIWESFVGRCELPADEVIALLCFRFDGNGNDADENLAWSITSNLKHRGYLGEYDPRHDPPIRARIEALKAGQR
ncbi:hypothetical protein HPC49_50785 [Pyxidicoccus fallax]|uniref:Uncharacterized protein n=1 Tax=Pyxidicoccus fallax TaxID=394095 RepID=A0A848LV04_9BACT|nr:hypothetical protein [Pyxidicoccus fallax]NMO21898.1 hypothetical protein [Pyxidicoccus fallax]NPC86461.1 hypothetical protein [Pyxidicoccus fallax]